MRILIVATLMALSTPALAQEDCRIQERLAELGFYDGEEDCDLNSRETREAIRAFQRRERLSVDGRAGEDTRYRLFRQTSAERDRADNPGNSGRQCTDEVIEAAVQRATKGRGENGARKAWSAEVLRRDELGINYAAWGDAQSANIRCTQLSTFLWNCTASGKPCRAE